MQPTTTSQDLLEQLLATLDSNEDMDRHAILDNLHPADIAQCLESLTPEQRPAVWSQVSTSIMGDILLEVSDGVREDLLSDMGRDELVAAVRYLDIDEIADLIPDLPDGVLAGVLFNVDKEARASLGEVLSYPEDTAGGLMNVDTVTIRENIPLRVVIRYLRLRGELPEYTDKLFVVNRDNQLRGVLYISTLLTSSASDKVGNLVFDDPVIFRALDEDDEVAQAFEKYNLISAPVVDDDFKLIGRITIDDVVDVIRDDAEHNVMARAGLTHEEDIFAPALRSARNRGVWLGINLITAFIAAWVISQFEGTIEKLVPLAVLMTVIASMGGNAGTQTLTIMIRGLSTHTITEANVWSVLKKELLVGGLNGLIWALVVAAVTILWYQDYTLGIVVAAAMMINLVTSAFAGAVLPLVLERFDIDPALAGGVALTTITDVIGFLAILGLAALFLI